MVVTPTPMPMPTAAPVLRLRVDKADVKVEVERTEEARFDSKAMPNDEEKVGNRMLLEV